VTPIKRCPVCGDYDIDFCNHCGVAAVEELQEEYSQEYIEACCAEWFDVNYSAWIAEQLKKEEDK